MTWWTTLRWGKQQLWLPCEVESTGEDGGMIVKQEVESTGEDGDMIVK